MLKSAVFILLFSLIQINFSLAQTRYFVKASATVSGTGKSWDQSFSTFQEALSLAVAGDEVWVAKGTYSPGSDVVSTFALKSGVKYYGGFEGTETSLQQRLLDSEKMFSIHETIFTGNNKNYHVVSQAAALNAETVLDGFTITKGNALMGSSSANYCGGGIYLTSSAIQLKNLRLKENTADRGSAIFGGTTSNFSNIIFENNVTNYGTFWNATTTKLEDVIFRNNKANGLGTARGGAIYNNAALTVVNGQFLDNESTAEGGAISNHSALNVYNSIFIRNRSLSVSASYSYAGAICNYTGTSNLVNSNFINNSIATNTNAGSALHNRSGVLNLSNSIVWGNLKAGVSGGAEQIGGLASVVTNSIVQEGYSGTNVYTSDPKFVDLANGNLRLTANSIAINTGENGRTEFETDLDGKTRIINSVVDLGPYEYQSTSSLWIQNEELNALARGLASTQQFLASGSAKPLTWSIAEGALPNGLSLEAATGKLLGTPIVKPGSFIVVIKVTDGEQVAFKQFVVNVLANPIKIYVKADANGSNNGTSWGHAFTLIQDATNVALSGDEIWVAKGVYSPGNLESDKFSLINGVKIYGGFAGTEGNVNERIVGANNMFTANESILHGLNKNYHVVFNDQALDANTMLDGFTITGGKTLGSGTTILSFGAGIANTLGLAIYKNLWIKNNEAFAFGGGIYNTSAATFEHILVEDNSIIGNAANYRFGAGIYNTGKGAIFNHVTIKNNKTGVSGAGGGFYNLATNVTLNNVLFSGNTAGTDGGGGFYQGITGLATVLNNCTFENNSTTGNGGAIQIQTAVLTLNDVVVKNNSASLKGGGIYNSSASIFNRLQVLNNTAVQDGGGLCHISGALEIRNGLFFGNSVSHTSYFGGGIYLNAAAKLYNITFNNNKITGGVNSGAAIYRATSGSATISNSIFWGNSNSEGLNNQLGNITTSNLLASYTISNSILQNGQIDATNNILNVDPLFVSAATGNLRLQSNSPAINAGKTADAANIPFDLDKENRVLNDVVDLGAYEYVGDQLTIQPAQLKVATRGLNFEEALTVSGADGPFTWTVVNNDLPKGLRLSSEGVISGIPLVAGNFESQVSVSNGLKTGIKTISFSINNNSAIIYVNQNANGLNTGETWANAYLTLSDAMTLAKFGDEIWVAKGIYNPGNAVTDSYVLIEGVKIIGGFAGTETQEAQRIKASSGFYTVNESILDGQKKNYHVVSNITAKTTATILDGFTITGGQTLLNTGSAAENKGAGIYNTLGSAIFQNLIVRGNLASNQGGGIFNSGTATFKNILVENNSILSTGTSRLGAGIYNSGIATFSGLQFIGNTGAASGGGLYNVAAITLENSLFKENSVITSGGGLYNAGISNFTNLIFEKNTSTGSGAGLYHSVAGSKYTQVNFIQNSSNTYGGGAFFANSATLNKINFLLNTSVFHGGAIYMSTGNLIAENIVFNKNNVTGLTTTSYGGALYQANGTVNLSNATFSQNKIAYTYTISAAGGAYYYASGSSTVYNSIFWGNTSSGTAVLDQVNAGVNLNYSIVQGGYPTGNNILIGNPDFEQAEANNLKLKNSSIAINAGINSKTTAQTDLDGLPRIVGELIDLGAYENPNANTARLKINPSTLTETARGTDYEQVFIAENATGTKTWSIRSGQLPMGLNLNSQSGVLSGKAMVEGVYDFVLGLEDGAGNAGNIQYQLKVNANPARFYVNAAATGFNNGYSWANALNKIQDALPFLKDGDELWVAKGNYNPGAHVDSTFYLVSGVKMYGGFAGTETSIAQRLANAEGRYTTNETVLDGSGVKRRLIFNNVILSETTLLDGFTIANGDATATTKNVGLGAGIFNGLASIKATFKNLIIKNNKSATSGAGMYNLGHEVKIINVLFDQNTSSVNGAALYNNGNSVQISQSTFTQNTSVAGGALYNAAPGIVSLSQVNFQNNSSTALGGAINNLSTMNIEDGYFKDNQSGSSGGAIYSTIATNLNRVSFISNKSVGHGGAVYLNTGTHLINNVVFSRNAITSTGNSYGGGLMTNSTTTISNSTFSNNSIARVAINGGGGLYSTVAKVYNSIFWGNTRGGGVAEQMNDAVPVVSNSTVQDGFANGTEISVGDPLFINAANDELALKSGSLAIDKGLNSFTNTLVDIANNPRVYNEVVDHGAYENQGGASLKVTPTVLPTFTRGEAVHIQMNVEGGTAPYQWSILSGELPVGLNISNTGLIYGRPMISDAVGSTFVVSVVDANLQGTAQFTSPVLPAPARIYVVKDAVGLKNGSSWKDAFKDFQEAISFSLSGDSIFVAKGDYSPGDLAANSFIPKENVKWYGGFEGTETGIDQRKIDANRLFTVNETILNGNKKNHHVISNIVALTEATVIDGFTITGGITSTANSGSTINGGGIYNTLGTLNYRNLFIKENNAYEYGGGIYNTAASIFENIRFQGNTSTNHGGGMYNNHANARLVSVSFYENTSKAVGAGLTNYGTLSLDSAIFVGNKATGNGGGMAVLGGTLTLTNSTFKDNTANNGGALINSVNTNIKGSTFEGNRSLINGGAIYNSKNLVLEDNVVKDNHAVTSGGGLFNTGTTTDLTSIDRNLFSSNSAGNLGGGIYNGGYILINNTLFTKNKVTSGTVSSFGGGMYHYGGSSTLINTTFNQNTTASTSATLLTGAGFYSRNSGISTISNSIFWNNKKANGGVDALGYTLATNLLVNHSIVQNGYATGTNILIGDPLFVSIDDLQLKPGSPAIDAGNNTNTITSIDFASKTRVINEKVDLGAYENQGSESLTILTETLPVQSRGKHFEIQFTIKDQEAPLNWNLASGALPLGVEITPEGLLTGRPMVAGSYTFVVSVSDGALVGSKQFTYTVEQASTYLLTDVAATGQNSGASWKNAFNTLQQAITAAFTGDEIWVAKGVYSAGLLATDAFTLKEGVMIYGGFAAKENARIERDSSLVHSLNSTVLDGSQGVPSRHVVFNNIALSAATVLEGVTVSGGQSSSTGDNEVSRGGGIYNIATVKAIFKNLVIKNNYGLRGGGVYNLGQATYQNITFENNTAQYGGGLFTINTTLSLTDIIFKNNQSTINGGGLYHNSGTIHLDRIKFIGNTSTQNGGGFYSYNGVFNLNNVVFSKNAVTTAAGYYGGGMFVYGTANLNNTTFYGNTIAYTHASTSGGAGLYRSSGTINVTNSIFWANKRGNNMPDQLNASIALSHSLVEGGYAAGTNILIGDPIFTNVNENNLAPKVGSPAIDAGQNATVTTSFDVAGLPRIFNDKVDLGAYENQGGNGLTIAVGPLAKYNRGEFINLPLVAMGGNDAYSWTIQSGTLPTGLKLSAAGELSGQPMVLGTYTFVIAVTDGDLNGSKQYSIEIGNGVARLYVSQNASGNNSGSSWTDAFNELTTAVQQSVNGDEIWVAKGEYSPGLLATSFFTLKEGVKWYGGFAGTETIFADRDSTLFFTQNATILEGSRGVASYHVVYNNAALTAATLVDGFIIQGGAAANTTSSVTLNNNYYGGGLFNSSGSGVFKNLWFRNNIASFGGAIYNTGAANFSAITFSNNAVKGRNIKGAALYNSGTITLSKVKFEENNISETAYIGYGAAIFNTGALTIKDAAFSKNKITNGQGAAVFHYSNNLNIVHASFTENAASTGAAIFVNSGTADLTQVSFNQNKSTLTGGAIYNASTLKINRAQFISNTSLQHGGAIWSNSNLQIDNSIFSKNSVNNTSGSFYGGAIYSVGTAMLSNLSFSKNSINYVNANTSLSFGGALYRSSGTTTLNNSVLWGNTRGNQIPDQLNAGIVVNHAIIQNNYPTGNQVKFGDPMFKDADQNDLHLKNGSLAVDVGDNTKQVFALDLDSNVRIVNEVIDLGAYENDGSESISILPNKLNPFVRGLDPQLQLTANGAQGPITWSLESGNLPIGVELTNDGLLKGVPTVTGEYVFVIGAQDSIMKGNRQFTVVVQAGKTILFVDEKAVGANNGSQWKDAFVDMQTALSQAVAGDEVWVAKGVYSPGLLATSRFAIKEGVKWYGGFAGVETTLAQRDTTLIRTTNQSVLDGSKGVASYHVVFNSSDAVTAATVVDGFSIQGGKSLSTYSSINYNTNYYGGGIFNNGGKAQFLNLWIKNNSATYGGGLYQAGLATFKNIIFSNNTATGRTPKGAAVYNAGGFTVDSVTFESNAIRETSSYLGYGAAIFSASNLSVNHATFKSKYYP